MLIIISDNTAANVIIDAVVMQIRSGVRAVVPVFSKTGNLPGVRTEVAVVEVDGRPFSLAVMTTYLARAADGERVTRDIASATWRYFDRLAKSGAYGRKYAGQPERLDWVALVGTLPWYRVREFVEHVVFHFSADRCAPQNAARA